MILVCCRRYEGVGEVSEGELGEVGMGVIVLQPGEAKKNRRTKNKCSRPHQDRLTNFTTD